VVEEKESWEKRDLGRAPRSAKSSAGLGGFNQMLRLGHWLDLVLVPELAT